MVRAPLLGLGYKFRLYELAEIGVTLSVASIHPRVLGSKILSPQERGENDELVFTTSNPPSNVAGPV